MKKPETVKVGRVAKYPWHELNEVGDFFVLPNATKANSLSIRSCGTFQKMKVGVYALKSGGYMVELKGRL